MSTAIALQQQQKDPKSGHVGNLTSDQEELLKKFWTQLFEIFRRETPSASNDVEGNSEMLNNEFTDSLHNNKKSTRISTFLRGNNSNKKPMNSEGGVSGDAEIVAKTKATQKPTKVKKSKDDDKYNESEELLAALELFTPQQIRSESWRLNAADDPDLISLRFLRARKWDVNKALAMMVSTLKWGLQTDVTSIVRGGESGLEQYFTEKNVTGSRVQLESGKSFCRGFDKEGRPIWYDEQNQEVLQRFTIWVMETCRLMIIAPVETACIVFDMTDFSLANDLQYVKFMIQCFEAYYPESLGICIVHKAPWVFQGVWKIISPLLDPVVASKIRFTSNDKDLLEYIPAKNLIASLGGEDPWEYTYVPPHEGENDRMKDEKTKQEKLRIRRELEIKFEELTQNWIADSSNEQIKRERDELKRRLRQAQLELDPYIRARTYYHRTGVLREDGSCIWK
ncbi:9141_t:CDS:2 [Ambispora gerdemannii]|uniref:9141_t:CDS:1 n=1 Tax=Ambispora gerdemannii TaxID=144530 RepID=A0A9N8YN80_9GLOM|nr:9141_t:CDS:2 [Ambispora gerdemannii]